MMLKDKNRLGYTIVEVMIVLAVSGMLLGSALILFRGTGQKTQFEQAVNDFNSKLQSSVKAISNELFPATGQYQCKAGPTLTTVTGTPQEQSTNQDCVYLGRIFHVAENSNKLRIYTVIGNRLCNGTALSCPANQLATTLTDTRPTVANTAIAGGNLNSDVLTETYTLSAANTTLQWARANGNTVNGDDVVGFYNGIGTSAETQAQSGALNLLARAYELSGNGLDGAALNNCIRNDTIPCATELEMWQLCFANGNSSNLRALVTLTTTSNAVQSTVKLLGC